MRIVDRANVSHGAWMRRFAWPRHVSRDLVHRAHLCLTCGHRARRSRPEVGYMGRGGGKCAPASGIGTHPRANFSFLGPCGPGTMVLFGQNRVLFGLSPNYFGFFSAHAGFPVQDPVFTIRGSGHFPVRPPNREHCRVNTVEKGCFLQKTYRRARTSKFQKKKRCAHVYWSIVKNERSVKNTGQPRG